jgi:hypothetical protein
MSEYDEQIIIIIHGEIILDMIIRYFAYMENRDCFSDDILAPLTIGKRFH